MADQRVTALAEELAPALSDLLYMVDDPSGVPVSKKVTMQNLLDIVNFVGFYATMSGDQSIDTGVQNVVQFDTETFDIGGYYNNGTYRWTPPAGHVILYTALCYTISTANGQCARILKNNALVANYWYRPRTSGVVDSGAHIMYIDEANGSDYYEAAAFHNYGSTQSVVAADSHFTGFAVPQG